MKMKYGIPYKGCKQSDITQRFGVNICSYQPNGHIGVDFSPNLAYGKFLTAPEDIRVVNIINSTTIGNSNTPLSQGYGILMESLAYPWRRHVYWHCLPVFPANIGDNIKQGQIVAQMGNSGFVLNQGQIVPVEIRSYPPYKGTHLHWEVLENGKNVDPLIDLNWEDNIQYDWITSAQEIINKIKAIIKR